jgi:hypothetical protein
MLGTPDFWNRAPLVPRHNDQFATRTYPLRVFSAISFATSLVARLGVAMDVKQT